jgi:hypothetical protein
MATMPTMAARAVRGHELWTPFGLQLAILRRGRSLRKAPNSFARCAVSNGGQGRNRTADASLFRAALYRLSYLAAALKSFSLTDQFTRSNAK